MDLSVFFFLKFNYSTGDIVHVCPSLCFVFVFIKQILNPLVTYVWFLNFFFLFEGMFGLLLHISYFAKPLIFCILNGQILNTR